MEDMLCDARTGLTKAVVMGPGRAVLFYGRHSLREGLTLGKAKDATFLLIGVSTWVGKPAYLAADPMTIQEDQQVIAQAVTDCWGKARGPGHPCANLLTQQTFRFDYQRDSPQRDTPGDPSSDHQPSTCQPLRGWDCNRCQRDQGQPPPQLPSPSLDHGFKSDRSLLLMVSSMSSMSDRSEGSSNPNVGDNTEKTGPIWRQISLYLKKRMLRMQ